LPAEQDRQGLRTLRQRLLQHVLTPLFVVWCLGTGVTVSIAYYFTMQAFDRSLLDDALSLSTHVRMQSGEPALDLSSRELASLLFDQSERMYFAVLDVNGQLLAGHASLFDARLDNSAPGRNARPFDLSDRVHLGVPVRVATLFATTSKPWIVVVAQTTRSRTSLIEGLMLYAVVPQAVLLFALAVWLLRAIDRDLEPLNRLRRALQRRDARDLSPIEPARESRDVAQLTDAANALLARIRAGIQAQREFTGNVAHELRNPMAGIRALAQYGLGQQTASVWREQLESIARSEVRASHLINQLLALALADEAREQLSLASLCVNDIVEDVVSELLRRHDSVTSELAVTGLDGPVWVRANDILLKGCIANLLDNALVYGRPQGTEPARIRIDVGSAQSSDRITIAVVDNGPGLNAELAAALQERWARGQGSDRREGGAGLGLAIVNRYASLLGATFELTPAPGGGLCATLTLPRAEPA